MDPTTDRDETTGMPKAPSARERLRDQTGTLKEDLRELGRLSRDAAAEKLGEAREAAAGYFDQGKRRAGEIEGDLEHYIREKPIQSLLIACGAGMLLGIVLSRR